MRPICRVEQPPAYPHKCIQCGLGVGPARRWFIDLGFDIAGEYRPINEGAVYLCDQCAPNLAESIIDILMQDEDVINNNRLTKERPTYDIADGYTGGSEFSDVPTGEPGSSNVPRAAGSGNVPEVDAEPSLPDDRDSGSSESSVGTTAESDDSDDEVSGASDRLRFTFDGGG